MLLESSRTTRTFNRLRSTVKAQGLLMEEVNFEWIPPGGEVESLL